MDWAAPPIELKLNLEEITTGISIRGLSFQGEIKSKGRRLVSEKLVGFQAIFQFGRSYLLNASVGDGAWALSWIVGGELQEQSGKLELDGNLYTRADRRKAAWLVRFSEIRRFGLFSTSVEAQIRHGLFDTSSQDRYRGSERQIREDFNLTPGRYRRPLSQLSSEAWRASCAIGLANGKKIFCFPHMDYLRPNFVDEYRHLWLEDTLTYLKKSGALVLFPAMLTPANDGLCDEVTSLT
ncbi:MAG: hypothetical protein IPK19_30655 [Chloroflexi bacterium]|nr:hypothetical protein [Chloroflexota bacterium]